MKTILFTQDDCKGDIVAAASGKLSPETVQSIPFNEICLGNLKFDRDAEDFSPEKAFHGLKYAKLTPTAEESQSINSYITDANAFLIADTCFPVRINGGLMGPNGPIVDNSAFFDCKALNLSVYNDRQCINVNSTVHIPNAACYGSEIAVPHLRGFGPIPVIGFFVCLAVVAGAYLIVTYTKWSSNDEEKNDYEALVNQAI